MRSPFLLMITALTSVLFISACSDQSEEASSCRYYVQQDLDNADYDSALERLTDTTCQDSYPDNEYLVDRASAYLGKAGYTFPNILTAALAESDDDDALSAFTAEIAKLKNDDSNENLALATADLESFLGGTCNTITNKTTTQEGLCLIQGVLSLTKTAVALDFLAGDGGISDSETLDLSSCAIQHSIDSSVSCDSGITYTDTDDVTFTKGDISKEYTYLVITDGDNTSYFLETTTGNTTESIVFTDGFCTNSFEETDAATLFPTTVDSSAISYVCPSESETDESVNEAVVDAINSAISDIASLAESSGADEDELQEAIDEFKKEVKGDNANLDDDITINDIVNYLNTLNS